MEEELTLDLRELFYILKKRIKLILIITITATVVSGVISQFMITPIYESKMSVFIGKEQSTITQDGIYTSSDVTMYQKLMKTYASIAESKTVIEAALKSEDINIKINEAQAMLSVTPEADTQIMSISIQSKNPKEAQKLVSAITTAFIERSGEVIHNGQVEVIDKPEIPEIPNKPNKKLNILIAFFLGLMISIGIVFVLEYLDNTIKTKGDIEKYIGIPVIGIIPEYMAK
ncbi:YveK family protein [Clostridium sp. DL1XJH146]